MNAPARIAGIGDNQPPSPFEAIKVHLDDLMTEARNWADGAAVETQGQADEISRLIEELRLGMDAADKARVDEKAPLDEQVAEIQERFNVYIAPLKNKTPGKVPLAMEALKRTLQPYLQRLDDEKRAAAEALRVQAEEAARIAAEAIRAAEPTNLAEREAAEGLVEDARNAAKAATRAEGDKAHAVGGSRAMGLRSHWTPTLTDGVMAARHYWLDRRSECEAFFQSLAEKDVREGKRTIPGFDVIEERRL